MVSVPRLLDRELGMVLNAGEEPPAGPRVEPGVGVASADIDSGAKGAIIVPFDGRSMSGVLGRNSKPGWQERWADFFKADEANSNHAHAVNEVGSKRSRQERRQDGWVNVIVHQNSAVDDPAKSWYLHSRSEPEVAKESQWVLNGQPQSVGKHNTAGRG